MEKALKANRPKAHRQRNNIAERHENSGQGNLSAFFLF